MKNKSIRERFTVGAVMLIAVGACSTTAWATALPITDTGILNIGNVGGSLVGLTGTPACINWGGGSTCVAGPLILCRCPGRQIFF